MSVRPGSSLTWWYDEEDQVWTGQDLAGVNVAEIRWAKLGEAEGGLGAVMRLMAGMQGVPQPELSPEGWYWSATIEQRGVWTRFVLTEEVEQEKQAISDTFFQMRALESRSKTVE